MLFAHILLTRANEIKKEFKCLLSDIKKNQAHPSDLLLVILNGNYYPEIKSSFSLKEKKSPYMIGPTNSIHSYNLHHEFIINYIDQSISENNYDYEHYILLHQWSPERKKDIDILTMHEGSTIQLEMLLYLKVWESDIFIKRLYQLTRLAFGESYDWHFSIPKGQNEKGTTGKRWKIINRKVRDRIKVKYPIIYEVIKESYITQLRNSIAHSNYSFSSRNINLNNFIEGDQNSKLKSISFNEWIKIFHNTIVLHVEMNCILFDHKKYYRELAEKNNLLLEARIDRTDPVTTIEYNMLRYDPEYNRWWWKAD